MRACQIQPTPPITRMMFEIFGPRIATTSNAIRMSGMESSTSTKRMINVSHAPPKKPANMPSVTPMTTAIATPAVAVARETRAPWMMRLSTSRPCASVPRG